MITVGGSRKIDHPVVHVKCGTCARWRIGGAGCQSWCNKHPGMGSHSDEFCKDWKARGNAGLLAVNEHKQKKAHDELNKPLRNCELYLTGDEAWDAFLRESTSNDDKHRNEDYERWLFGSHTRRAGNERD